MKYRNVSVCESKKSKFVVNVEINIFLSVITKGRTMKMLVILKIYLEVLNTFSLKMKFCKILRTTPTSFHDISQINYSKNQKNARKTLTLK